MRGKANTLHKIGGANHGNREGDDIWKLRDYKFTVDQGLVL